MKLAAMVEARVAEAERRGALSGLPGEGQPLPPDDLASLPEAERLEARIARAAGPPVEVELLRELEVLRAELAEAEGAERAALVSRIAELELRLSVAFERSGRAVMVSPLALGG